MIQEEFLFTTKSLILPGGKGNAFAARPKRGLFGSRTAGAFSTSNHLTPGILILVAKK